jgi:hypothetical protein
LNKTLDIKINDDFQNRLLLTSLFLQEGRVLLKCTAMLGNYFIKSEEVSLQHALRGPADADAALRDPAAPRRPPYTGGLFEDSSDDISERTHSSGAAVKYDEDTVRYYSDILVSGSGFFSRPDFRWQSFLFCLHVLLSGLRWN